MKILDYKIEGLTLAITNMEKMLSFYSKVFNMQFTEKEMYDSKLYASTWGGLELLFCPAHIAGNKATQNRHQFDIVINNIQKIIATAKQHGGKTMDELVEDKYCKSIGVFDPDNNSIIFKEFKKQ
jgi:predicted enzyme related to lactoylglutathione lyase